MQEIRATKCWQWNYIKKIYFKR